MSRPVGRAVVFRRGGLAAVASPWALDLDLTAEALDPRVTFTRNSMALAIDEAGQYVYGDHNLALWSEDIGNAVWTRAGTTPAVVTSNAGLAPDGSNTAALIDLTTSADARVAQTFSGAAPSGFALSMSVWLRAEPGQSGGVGMQARRADGSTPNTVLAVTDQWQRFTWTAPAASGSTAALWWIANRGIGGHSLNRVLAWGAQFEFAAQAGAYRKTTSTAWHAWRRTHDPVTLAPLGRLVEPSRTNLFSNSSNLSANVSAQTNSSINATAAPLEWALVENTATAAHFMTWATVPVASGSVYTTTIEFKAAGRIRLRLQAFTSVAHSADFDASLGTVIGPTNATGSIAAMGGGWYRCSITYTAGATVSSTTAQILTGSSSYAGDGVSGVVLRHPQVELGDYATSPILTTGAAAIRAADSAVITGANFSSWYAGATECTIYAEGTAGRVGTTALACLDNGSNSEFMGVLAARSASSSASGQVFAGGVLQADWTQGAHTGGAKSVAMRVKANSVRVAANGVLIGAEDTTATYPNVNRLVFGQRSSGGVELAGTLKTVRIARVGFGDAELAALTA